MSLFKSLSRCSTLFRAFEAGVQHETCMVAARQVLQVTVETHYLVLPASDTGLVFHPNLLGGMVSSTYN